MCKQLFIAILAVATLSASLTEAAECQMFRIYKDEKGILRHFSLSDLGQEAAENKYRCSSACNSEKSYISQEDKAALAERKGVKQVLARCTFRDPQSGVPVATRLSQDALMIAALQQRRAPQTAPQDGTKAVIPSGGVVVHPAGAATQPETRPDHDRPANMIRRPQR